MTEQTETPPAPPASDNEPTGDFVCPNCHRWFPKRSMRLTHVLRSHPEVALK